MEHVVGEREVAQRIRVHVHAEVLVVAAGERVVHAARPVQHRRHAVEATSTGARRTTYDSSACGCRILHWRRGCAPVAVEAELVSPVAQVREQEAQHLARAVVEHARVPNRMRAARTEQIRSCIIAQRLDTACVSRGERVTHTHSGPSGRSTRRCRRTGSGRRARSSRRASAPRRGSRAGRARAPRPPARAARPAYRSGCTHEHDTSSELIWLEEWHGAPRRREERRDLIAEAPVICVLHDGHQLHCVVT